MKQGAATGWQVVVVMCGFQWLQRQATQMTVRLGRLQIGEGFCKDNARSRDVLLVGADLPGGDPGDVADESLDRLYDVLSSGPTGHGESEAAL